MIVWGVANGKSNRLADPVEMLAAAVQAAVGIDDDWPISVGETPTVPGADPVPV